MLQVFRPKRPCLIDINFYAYLTLSLHTVQLSATLHEKLKLKTQL